MGRRTAVMGRGTVVMGRGTVVMGRRSAVMGRGTAVMGRGTVVGSGAVVRGRSVMMMMMVTMVGVRVPVVRGRRPRGVVIVVAVVPRPFGVPRVALVRVIGVPLLPRRLGVLGVGSEFRPSRRSGEGRSVALPPRRRGGGGGGGAAESPVAANIVLEAFAGAWGGLLPRAHGRGQRGAARPGGEIVGALVPLHRLVVRIHQRAVVPRILVVAERLRAGVRSRALLARGTIRRAHLVACGRNSPARARAGVTRPNSAGI